MRDCREDVDWLIAGRSGRRRLGDCAWAAGVDRASRRIHAGVSNGL